MTCHQRIVPIHVSRIVSSQQQYLISLAKYEVGSALEVRSIHGLSYLSKLQRYISPTKASLYLISYLYIGSYADAIYRDI